ncbi:type VI protein secretion system component VasK [Agromyces terreus]|uniref:Type VI protein secretion system component VasK n=1 Tax=Agromyces terreus TaxID=424795 RepID=A0A9X2KAW7_9MICO|nr:PLD nuclease N-terminal domain-containing protein [Agromyces terreus]MCP2370014.1 type VI protein secretion system component VasK [Agromyces terreus]
MVRVWFVLGIAAVIFWIYAIADCAFFDRSRIRGVSRGWWVTIVVLLPVIGGILWFVIGRGRAYRAGGKGPLAPDDDVEFLRGLRSDAEQDERIRRLEQELADLDTDEPHDPESGDVPHPDSKRHDGPDAAGEAGTSGRPNG